MWIPFWSCPKPSSPGLPARCSWSLKVKLNHRLLVLFWKVQTVQLLLENVIFLLLNITRFRSHLTKIFVNVLSVYYLINNKCLMSQHILYHWGTVSLISLCSRPLNTVAVSDKQKANFMERSSNAIIIHYVWCDNPGVPQNPNYTSVLTPLSIQKSWVRWEKIMGDLKLWGF